jgi:predicted  nucleic acid-binding Zn-ribbon protein
MPQSYCIKCGCGHVQGEHRTFLEGGCTNCRCKTFALPPEEPPMTPEEEEQAPEDECPECGDTGACNGGPCPPASPPQPEQRPPYAVAYSVQGHLYEVALSGDATVRAVDGALVIQHHLGPVAGIVQTRPVINERSADGAEAEH